RAALAVAVLLSEFLRGRDARDLLDDVLPDEGRVVRRPAGHELDARHALGEEAVHFEVREAAEERLVDRLRRLVDLLQHEVLEASLLSRRERPRHALPLRLASVALAVLEPR